ncbi:hypothetical protein [Roseimaritima ulvae]|uniref:Uncharacterized protein n=1 Tax=Roseimaritima ulvae TaxID=980254 RepID=A0A5B9QVF7_9BACT|nr:hypothetical protein [Roseimaritima ulvae]QEG41790.1 hypothetical protein UC8_38160 [Roseimaritima ulvae]
MRPTVLCVCLCGALALAANCAAQGYDQWNPLRPQPPHLVLRQHAPPQPPAVPDMSQPYDQPVVVAPAAETRSAHERHADWAYRHGLKKDLEYVTGNRAPLPQATTALRQKTPYSYGYFGAMEKRHWTMHFGSRQSFTRWTQR